MSQIPITRRKIASIGGALASLFVSDAEAQGYVPPVNGLSLPVSQANGGTGATALNQIAVSQFANPPIRNILDFAGGTTIGDGTVHKISTAPSSSIFYGITTISALAAITIEGIQPFSFLTNNTTQSNGVNLKNIFTGTTSGSNYTPYYQLSNSSVPNLDIAWLAIQAAILLGPCRIPAGEYIIGSTLPLTIMIMDNAPEPLINSGLGSPIYITGDGVNATYLIAGHDFGSGSYLLCCGDPGANPVNLLGRFGLGGTLAPGSYCGEILNLTLVSSGSPSSVITTPPVNMSGFAHGPQLIVRDMWIEYFNKGYSEVNYNNFSYNVTFFYCYFDVYFEYSISNILGNEYRNFNHLYGFAAYACDPGVSISGYFSGEHYIQCCYVMFGVSGNGYAGSNTFPMVGNVIFDYLSVEGLGMALCHDDNGWSSGGTYTNANKTRNVDQLNIQNFVCSFGSTYLYTSAVNRSRRALFDVNGIQQCVISNISSSFIRPSGGSPPVSQAVFNINSIDGVHLSGIMTDIFNDCTLITISSTNYSTPFFKLPGDYSGSEATWEEFGIYNGRFYSAQSAGNYITTTIGDVFECSGSFGNAVPGGTNAIANAPVFGLCMQGNVTLGAGGYAIPLVDKGYNAQANTGSQAPVTGPYQKCTGIGANLTITPGSSGGTSGNWTTGSTGGGTTAATGTFTVSGGAITAWTITSQGAGMSSQPTITASSGSFPTGGALTPQWPSALATPGSSSNFANTFGVLVNSEGSSPSRNVLLKLIGLN